MFNEIGKNVEGLNENTIELAKEKFAKIMMDEIERMKAEEEKAAEELRKKLDKCL